MGRGYAGTAALLVGLALSPGAAGADTDAPEIVYEKRPAYVNLIPFGAGQFQNDHPRKGWFFLTSQAVTASVSVGLFGYQLVKYGDRHVPRDEAATVRRLQKLQIGSGLAFLGLAMWGIVDAFHHHQPRVIVQPTASSDSLGIALSFMH